MSNFREMLGLALIIIGFMLLPVAWAFDRSYMVIAFILFFVGMVLFYTERTARKQKELESYGPSGDS